MIVLLIIILIAGLIDYRLGLGILNVGLGFVIGLFLSGWICLWGLQTLLGLV